MAHPRAPEYSELAPALAHGAPESGGDAPVRGAPGNVWERFERCARGHGARVAVDDGRISWTYSDLAAKARETADAINGVIGRAPALVAVVFDLEAAGIGAMMGVIGSGHAYVGMDPKHPDAWLRGQLEKLGVPLVVTSPDLAARCRAFAPSGVAVLEFDATAPPSGDGVPCEGGLPSDPACVISTSGSTGEPKGAIKTNAALLLSARHYIAGGNTTPDDRFLLLAPVGFMASIPPILCSLLNGAALFPFDVTARGLGALAPWIEERGITVYHSVPTLLRRLAQSNPRRACLRSVRLVRLAGETIRASDIRLARGLFPGPVSLHLLMGAAETSLIAEHTIGPGDHVPDGIVPMGRPATGVTVRLVTDDGRDAAPGEQGRMHVRGATISPGYWRNPEATRASFSSEPGVPGEWTYRTSDICRWRPDGLLELLGRTEEFVKIGGVRVCPALVETALAEVPGVGDTAVVARPDESGQDRLVAYYIARPGASPRTGELRQALRDRVPAGMVPAQFVRMDAMPLTANGKVDRNALPNPPTPARPKWRRPRDAVETHVALAWERVLGIEQVGLDDRFSDLGGTSLDAVAVMLELERTMARRLPDSALALHDRMEDLAAAVAKEDVRPTVLEPLRPEGSKRPFFCVHGGLGTVGTFGPLARGLDPDRPFYALQSPGIADATWPLLTIEQMAERYIPEIERVDPAGPYLLGGVCMGGLVAWEMARRLKASGKRVSLLVLIETNRPGPREGRTCAVRAAYWARFALRVARWRVQTIAARAAGRASIPESWWPGWRQFVLYANSAAARRCRPGRYDGEVAILMGAQEAVGSGADPRLAMRELTSGAVRTAFVPGTHHDVCDGSHIHTLAGLLREMFDQADSQEQRRVLSGP